MENWVLRSRLTPKVHAHEPLRNYDPTKWDRLLPHELQDALTWGKPRRIGNTLWYQVGDSWEDWCASEQPDWSDPARNLRVVLAVNRSRMAVLHTLEDVRAFGEKYRSTPEEIGMHYNFLHGLSWRRIMAEYDGVEVPSFRRNWGLTAMDDPSRWIYGWDVSSGVVWNAKDACRVLRVEDATLPAPVPDDTRTLDPATGILLPALPKRPALGRSLRDLIQPGKAPASLISNPNP